MLSRVHLTPDILLQAAAQPTAEVAEQPATEEAEKARAALLAKEEELKKMQMEMQQMRRELKQAANKYVSVDARAGLCL